MSGCENCAAGQYDHIECTFRHGSLIGTRAQFCKPGDELCLYEVTRYAMDSVEEAEAWELCLQAVVEISPFANALTVQGDEGFHLCYAGVGIPAQLESGQVSCMFYTDPGTPCIDCPAGTFSAGTTLCESCPTDVGMYAPLGSSSIDDCQPCPTGWVDDDYDAGTPCIPCPSGSFSNVSTGLLGINNCELCPLASMSVPGSTERRACMPTVQAVWTICEPCASEYVETEFERVDTGIGSSAYYNFAGSADDTTGSSHGQVTGATLVPDRFGAENEAYQFDGTSSISIPCPFTAGSEDFSISVWLSPSVVGTPPTHTPHTHPHRGTKRDGICRSIRQGCVISLVPHSPCVAAPKR